LVDMLIYTLMFLLWVVTIAGVLGVAILWKRCHSQKISELRHRYREAWVPSQDFYKILGEYNQHLEQQKPSWERLQKLEDYMIRRMPN
jgi:hypothetical protein